MKWTNAVGKMALINVLNAELPQNFNLFKKTNNQKQYLGSTRKQGSVE